LSSLLYVRVKSLQTVRDFNPIFYLADIANNFLATLSWIPAVLNDTGGSSDIFGSYTIVIKRVK